MTILDLQRQTCLPTLKLLGDFWTLRIVDVLSDGELHYCELQRLCGNVNPVTLTTKLRNLQKSGLVERHAKSRTEVSYSLTKLGQKMLSVLKSIDNFAKYLAK